MIYSKSKSRTDFRLMNGLALGVINFVMYNTLFIRSIN
ncbi:MAG: hypothetical protein JWR44_302 [Hymenobacter sp.]|nr:hypothetical protein [Hymenobacter sp.]